MALILLWLAALIPAVRAASVSATATFDANGITGTIKLSQASQVADTVVLVNLTGITNNNNGWHVHVFPANDGCEATSVAGHYNPMGATLTSCTNNHALCEIGDLSNKHGFFTSATVNAQYIDTNLPLQGNYSVVGRSIVIHAAGGARMSCATIHPDDGRTTLAGFENSQILGSVRFTEYGTGSDTQLSMFANIQYKDPAASTQNVPWVITSSRPVSGVQSTPFEAGSAACTASLASSVILNNTAVGKISIGSKAFFTITNLTLSRVGLKGLHLEGLGCTTIGRVVRANFDYANSVYGYIEMAQTAENMTTEVTVSLTGLTSLDNAWHVHQFPVSDGCGAQSTGGHYNPYSVSLGYSTPCTDQSVCEMGDMSGKHGKFSASDVNLTFTDTNLNLNGVNSVVGRSIVIHESGGARYACANIFPIMEFSTVTALFDNSGGVIGTIRVSQETFDVTAESWVLADLSYADGTSSSSSHNYHVHVTPTSLDTDDCGSAVTGGHWNPRLVGNTQCSRDPSKWDLCEIGDLSNKHGQIDIPSSNSSKVFYTDSYLPLRGGYSIAGRSIVIHASNGGASRIACATLGKQARAEFVGSVTGTVDFIQAYANAETTVILSLSGLTASPTRWEIRKEPSLGGCIGGNPFQASTDDQYPAGNLTRMFGALMPSSGMVNTNFTGSRSTKSAALQLFGSSSIVGLTLVLITNGVDVACAPIGLPYTMTTLIARFNDTLTGTLTMKQMSYDKEADTVVTVDLQYANGDSTVNHNYHVHVNKIDSSLTGSDKCGSSFTGGHWDPQGILGPYCSTSESDWDHCEVGDLSGKHGKLNIPSFRSQRVVYSDTNLPLDGNWEVFGRSIVVHAANAGAARMDCADLESVAFNSTSEVVLVIANLDISQVTEAFRTKFLSDLASYLKVPKRILSVTFVAGSVIAQVRILGSGGGFSSGELQATLLNVNTTDLSSNLGLSVTSVGTSPPPTPSPTLAPSTSNKDDDNDDLSGGEIAGVVIGVLVFVGIIGGLAIYLMKKQETSYKNTNSETAPKV